jgi:hypothetical protein
MSPDSQYSLRVGQTATVRPGFFKATIQVVYSGMPSESTYSVVVVTTAGHHSSAYNLFLSVDQTEFDIPKGRIRVTEVSRDRIRFEFRG